MKRLLDVCISAGLLIALSPLMAAIAVLILVMMGRPVLFRQERLGHQGRRFVLLKVRTMRQAADRHGRTLPDERRLTRLGRLLRRTSLDELPQLVNVLRGEMSLVGPRPLLVEYRDLYTPEQWRRHEVLPGVVGPVAVKGRNALSWEEKFRLDVWYVDNSSLWIDLKIMAAAAWKIVTGDGVSQPGHATVEYFRGSVPKS
ncbi:MAG: sugar transferase [Actinomycetota bacterium]